MLSHLKVTLFFLLLEKLCTIHERSTTLNVHLYSASLAAAGVFKEDRIDALSVAIPNRKRTLRNTTTMLVATCVFKED